MSVLTGLPADTRAEAELDAALGDPRETARAVAESDAAQDFPTLLCSRLDAYGMPAQFVPAEHGGGLDDHERLVRLWRTVARRDLSAAIAHGKTYLGTAPVWLAGDERQCSRLAEAVLGGEPVALALSEPEHGADLLGGAVTAARTRPPEPPGFRLHGVKWPVNNATRADLLTVLARTGEPGRARGQSLFLIDKRDLAPGSWRALPKAATHGVRGIDISGVEFDGAVVADCALLGARGDGLEILLRTLQLTRTACAALSLGAAEHALRLVARFGAGRIIQRRPLLDRPHPAAVLARCAAEAAAAEAAALFAARSVHSLTGELAVTSAVVKALAPALVDDALGELSELLGVRSYLTGEYDFGAYQKLWRDHQVVSVFDGSTPVNRAALAMQFPRLARAYAAGECDEAGVAEAAAVGTRPRPLDRSALSLSSRTGCSLVQSLPALAEQHAAPGLAGYAAAFEGAAAHVCALAAELRPAARPAVFAYELAEAYELCFAAAACLHLWSAGAPRHEREPLWEDGLWVRAALRVLLDRVARVLREAPVPDPAGCDAEQVAALLARRVVEAAECGAPVTPFGAPFGTDRTVTP